MNQIVSSVAHGDLFLSTNHSFNL